MKNVLFYPGLLMFLLLFQARGADSSSYDIGESKAFVRNRSIGRGMNLGNALEAPKEGEWGLIIQESYIQAVADAGFDSVRLPICWPAHVSGTSPGLIDKKFLRRVDNIVDWSLKRKLAVIVTIHHFNELYEKPDNEACRKTLFSIWRQLTAHFSNYSREQLFFEVLNEPHGNLTSDKWNRLIPEILAVIRAGDKDRTLIIDAADYAYHGAIEKLAIPEWERNVIASVRYYLPFEFTHQGAHWVEGSDKWLGKAWSGKAEDLAVVDADLKLVKDWSAKNKRPVTIGEFGSIIFADKQSRVTWTRSVREKFETNGFSWCYFDFGVLFKAYDIQRHDWLPGFKDALADH
ncbi:MAG: glycoside hydrolase family 5 protein [Verrucomicrobiota bacterium]|jgi:endoglucanase